METGRRGKNRDWLVPDPQTIHRTKPRGSKVAGTVMLARGRDEKAFVKVQVALCLA